MKQKRNKTLDWIGLIALLIVINVVAALVHRRIDLTEEKRYSLSQPTKELLRGLKNPVVIDVYLEGDEMPAVVRRFRNAVYDFLFEAREYSNQQLEFNFINPLAGDTAVVRQMEDSLALYGLQAVLINAPDEVGDELKVKKLIHGAVVRHGDKSEGIDLLKGARSFGTEPDQLAALYNNVEASIEYKFASAIQKVSNETRPVVAYALGHGEAWGYNIDDAVRTLLAQYSFDTLNLRQVPYIPSQVNALIILKPVLPFNDADKLKIDQYVMNGGKVFWMVDNMYAEFDSLRKSGGFIAFDRGLNLEDLFFNYGVRINQSLMQDMQSDQLGQMTQDGQQRLVQWPFFPILNGTDHPISKNLDGVVAQFPSTLDTVEAAGIKKSFLLRSSDNTRVLPAPARIDFEFLQIAPDTSLFRQRQVPVAVLLEGSFQSAYRGRVPRSVADTMAAYGVPYKASAEGVKMIVVADGDIAQNMYSASSGPLPMGYNFYTNYTFGNKDFYENCLDYLLNPSNILQARAKEYTLRRLNGKKVLAEKTKWQMINIGLPLLLMLLAGFLYQYLRKRKYTAL